MWTLLGIMTSISSIQLVHARLLECIRRTVTEVWLPDCVKKPVYDGTLNQERTHEHTTIHSIYPQWCLATAAEKPMLHNELGWTPYSHSVTVVACRCCVRSTDSKNILLPSSVTTPCVRTILGGRYSWSAPKPTDCIIFSWRFIRLSWAFATTKSPNASIARCFASYIFLTCSWT